MSPKPFIVTNINQRTSLNDVLVLEIVWMQFRTLSKNFVLKYESYKLQLIKFKILRLIIDCFEICRCR